jgi:NAD(P)H-hydrate epimerase
VKIVSVAEMRALEAGAGVSEAELQGRAAQVLAEEVAALATAGGRVVVLVGHGNNGRDGALAGELLAVRGYAVSLVLAPRHALTEAELARMKLATIAWDDEPAIRTALAGAHVAIDALAGIGLSGALREPLASLAKLINDSPTPLVIAVDVPSGIDADSGAVPGEAVRADVTVTLGAFKQGLLRFPAAQYAGRLIGRDIGIPSSAEHDLPYTVLDASGLVPPERPLNAHKYHFGRVLVLAGTDHYLGAPVLCSSAALRVGAGLVTVGSTADVRRNVASHLPEATFTTTDVGYDAAALKPYLETHTALVVGPGLGRGPDVTSFVRDVLLQRPRGGSVIDADALVALAEIPDWWTLLGPNTVLTPHSGELERLVGDKLGDEPLWALAGRLAQQWKCFLLAKGPFTCIAEPSGQVHVWPRANAALATGGTGDVLAGLCGGLLAQGCSAPEAARLAVGVHGLAAERALASRGWRTLLASDLVTEVPAVLASLTRRR